MSKLTWKWRKNQSTSFNAYGASGIYNFYYSFEEGKDFSVKAFTDDKGKTIKYKLYETHQLCYQEPTYHKEFDLVFNTSLEAKLYAESLKSKGEV